MKQTAETIFVGGSLFEPGSVRSRPGVLAVRDGRIAAVGGDELLELSGRETEVVDLEGGLLLPGFQDAHVHPVMAGVDLLRCELHGTESAQECLDRIDA